MSAEHAAQRATHAFAERLIGICHQLARYSEEAGRTTRTFLAPSTQGVHQQLRTWMEQLGMTVMMDGIGNMRGLYPAVTSDAPRLLIGSHIDTVPNSGAFDGVLGVVIGLGLIERLEGRKLDYAIEVIAFSEEEGVRFGIPFLGSRALVGTLDAALLARQDSHQISVEQAVRDFGLNPGQIPAAGMGSEYAAYLEFHIEQGPVLEQIGVGLGVVETVVGQTRMDCTFQGQANHAGTTPMFLRKDALTAACEWVAAVENRARATPGLVATVGRLEVSPGTGNVIPGEVKLSLDVRHAMDHTRTSAGNMLLTEARRIAAERGITFNAILRLDQPAVPMNEALIQQLAVSVSATGYPLVPITSGAGHDAMIIAEKLPCAMLFLRSPGGISHHPNETVLVPDVKAAIDVGLHFLEHLNLQQL